MIKEFSLENFEELWSTNRSTATSSGGPSAPRSSSPSPTRCIAFPIAFFMAKVASRRGKAVLVIAVLMPLWSSYLVKVLAWRELLAEHGVHQLGARAARPARARRRPDRGLAGDELPLAAVHDPADLRRPRTDPELADQRLRGPRRPPLHDLPAGDPAARLPGRRRRLDLHLLAHPRRLHRAAAGLQRPVHRHRRSSHSITNNQPFAAALALVPIVVVIAYLGVARKLGAFEHV